MAPTASGALYVGGTGDFNSRDTPYAARVSGGAVEWVSLVTADANAGAVQPGAARDVVAYGEGATVCGEVSPSAAANYEAQLYGGVWWLDAAGALLREVRFGEAEGPTACTSIVVDGQGNIVVAGRETRGGVTAPIVRKFTGDGAELWSTWLEPASLGAGVGRHRIFEIAVMPGDEIIAAGVVERMPGTADVERRAWAGRLTP